jgi:hypothetical protein
MKILFLHIVKTGGTTVNAALSNVARRRNYFLHIMDGERANDFTPAQLEQIATAPGFDQYAHAHIGAFDERLHSLFRENGWFTVCFIRNLGDLLCSLYFHSKAKAEFKEGQTLDAFANELLDSDFNDDPNWRLPPWHSQISFVRIFSPSRLRSFLSAYMNEDDAKIRHLNASEKGNFGHHCATGDIAPATIAKIFKHEQSKLYRAQNVRENL